MMKVVIGDRSGETELQVCGRIAGCWVSELERAWRAVQFERSGAAFCIDLRGVSFIDADGERLLRTMHRDGVRFLTAGLLIQEIVNQITGEKE